MAIDLHKLRIKADGPTSNHVKILTEAGEEVRGVTALGISIMPGGLIQCTLSVHGAHEVDLEELEATLDFDDASLVKEARRRGYVVTVDDADIERELHQADEHNPNQVGDRPVRGSLAGSGGRRHPQSADS